MYYIVNQWIIQIYIVIYKTVKIQFCPSFVPQIFEGLFLSLLCPSGTSGDKNDHLQGIKHRNTKIYKEIIDEI